MKYTDEELKVFRMCNKLKREGCKTSEEAESILSKVFWDLSRSKIHTLVKDWFYNREKIDLLLNENVLDTRTE